MPTRSLCRECDGTGWIPYHSETVDGELEAAYRLCPRCYAPRLCMGSRSDHLCPRPGTMRYSLGYYCKEHVKDIRIDEEVYHAYEAICYPTACFIEDGRVDDSRHAQRSPEHPLL